MPKVPTRQIPAYLTNKQSIRILDAAREVFIQEGFAAFSARRVAKVARLSLGSVQHVFPTTNQLLAAMIDHVRDTYEQVYRDMERRLPFSAEERLRALLDYLVADICKKDVRHFFIGFWALSCHNSQAHRAMREAYGWQVNRVAGFISAARSGLDDEKALQLARHVTALIEGMVLFVGMSEKPVHEDSPMLAVLRTQIWSMTGARTRAAGPSARPSRRRSVKRARSAAASVAPMAK